MDFISQHRRELCIAAGVAAVATTAAIVKNIWYDREWEDLESGKKCLLRNFLVVPVITAIALATFRLCVILNEAIWQRFFSASYENSSSYISAWTVVDAHKRMCSLVDGLIVLPAFAAAVGWHKIVNSTLDKWYQPNPPPPQGHGLFGDDVSW